MIYSYGITFILKIMWHNLKPLSIGQDCTNFGEGTNAEVTWGVSWKVSAPWIDGERERERARLSYHNTLRLWCCDSCAQCIERKETTSWRVRKQAQGRQQMSQWRSNTMDDNNSSFYSNAWNQLQTDHGCQKKKKTRNDRIHHYDLVSNTSNAIFVERQFWERVSAIQLYNCQQHGRE